MYKLAILSLINNEHSGNFTRNVDYYSNSQRGTSTHSNPVECGGIGQFWLSLMDPECLLDWGVQVQYWYLQNLIGKGAETVSKYPLCCHCNLYSQYVALLEHNTLINRRF
jgi:hypothetical protein